MLLTSTAALAMMMTLEGLIGVLSLVLTAISFGYAIGKDRGGNCPTGSDTPKGVGDPEGQGTDPKTQK